MKLRQKKLLRNPDFLSYLSKSNNTIWSNTMGLKWTDMDLVEIKI